VNFFLILGLIIFGVLFATALIFLDFENNNTTLTNKPQKSSLIINGDEFFQNNKLVFGKGTIEEPYKISALKFENGDDYAIQIKNVNSFLSISDIEILSFEKGILIEDSSKITLKNIKIKNIKENGITLKGSNQTIIKNNIIDQVEGLGIYFDRNHNSDYVNNNIIENNEISNIKGDAIVTRGNFTYIINNNIFNIENKGLIVVAPLVGNVIYGNNFNNVQREVIHVVGHINDGIVNPSHRFSSNSFNVYVINNTISNFFDDAIEIEGGVHQASIIYNTIRDSGKDSWNGSGHMNGLECYKGSYNIIWAFNVIENINGHGGSNNGNGILIMKDCYNQIIFSNSIKNVTSKHINVHSSKDIQIFNNNLE